MSELREVSRIVGLGEILVEQIDATLPLVEKYYSALQETTFMQDVTPPECLWNYLRGCASYASGLQRDFTAQFPYASLGGDSTGRALMHIPRLCVEVKLSVSAAQEYSSLIETGYHGIENELTFMRSLLAVKSALEKLSRECSILQRAYRQQKYLFDLQQ